MGSIRLYRNFYRIDVVISANTTVDVYNLINPFSLSANTFISGTSSPTVENELITTQESLGVYFVDLNPLLYTSDNIYDLVWYITYVNGAPIKRLITRFKINAVTIGQNIDVDIISQNIKSEIISQNIDVEIISQNINSETMPQNIDIGIISQNINSEIN